MATPKHKKLCPSGHEIHNFGIPFLSHHFFTLSLSELCPRLEKKIFKEIHKFYIFYPKITSPWDKGHATSLLTLQMLHTKFDKNLPSGS